MDLGERIKSLRREKGMTQEYLAQQLQVTRRAVSKWERGTAAPSMEKLLALSRLLGVPLEQLAGTAKPSTEAGRQRCPQWIGRLLLAAAAALLLLAGWGLGQAERRDTAAPSAESAGPAAYERLEEHVLGESLSELADGRSVWLRLVLLEGGYFTDEYEDYLPGGGVYPVNYRGSYQLEVWDAGGNCLSSRPLDADFEGGPLCFPGGVDIAFFDYNGDGRPEFTIGQYGSSSTNLYNLYTLEGDGDIVRSCPEPIPDSSDTHSFSIVFPRGEGEEGKGFRACWWDNALGGMQQTPYRWDAAAGRFLPA